jgi:hypothetical protein
MAADRSVVIGGIVAHARSPFIAGKRDREFNLGVAGPCFRLPASGQRRFGVCLRIRDVVQPMVQTKPESLKTREAGEYDEECRRFSPHM